MSNVSKLRGGAADITCESVFGAVSWPQPLPLGRKTKHHTASHCKRQGGQERQSHRLQCKGAALPPPTLARRAHLLQVARVLNALRRHASLVVIFLIAITPGFATLQLKGTDAFMTALWHAWELFLFIVPSLVAGLLLASALRQLLSPDTLARWMGAESGIFGLFIATLVGTLSPGGPMAAFPLVLVLAGAGADRGATGVPVPAV